MRNSIFITAALKLTSLAEQKITSWPLKDKARISFWIKDIPQKTFPCEIQDSGKFDKVEIEHEVSIMLPLEAESILFKNSIFYIGVNHEPIGIGHIMDITSRDSVQSVN
ncbi:MAG: hypothetical protein EOO20_12665 [Chryseobacterium sp.]|nr:MAG: hypothetical protein EOO20_12665 [Chryseobacterium sp.]